MSYDPIQALHEIAPARRPAALQRGGVRQDPWWVRLLRRCLVAQAYSGAGACPDCEMGVFTPELDAIVHLYQARHGLSPDGVVGPMTWASLAGEAVGSRQQAVGSELAAPSPEAQQLRVSILDWARCACDELRIREHGRNNHGVLVELILDYAQGNAGDPWCVAFVRACLALACASQHAPTPAIPSLSCSAVKRWAKREGRIRPLADAEPADLYVLDLGHICIIEHTNPDGTLTTIEGNTSSDPTDVSSDADGDGVYRRHRDPRRLPGVVVRMG